MSLPAIFPWGLKFDNILFDQTENGLLGIFHISLYILVFFIIISMAEIILCLISRWLWRRQEPIDI